MAKTTKATKKTTKAKGKATKVALAYGMSKSERNALPKDDHRSLKFDWSGGKAGEWKDRESVHATKWNDKTIALKRATHNKVTCNNVPYRSVWEAWQELGLKVSHHQAFRKLLKIRRKLAYKVGNKSYAFAIAK